MMKVSSLLVLSSVLVCCVGATVQADALHPQLDSKHTFILGGYRQEADAEFFANPDRFDKSNIKLGALGVDDTDTSWMLEYRYRMTDKWILSAGAYTFDTSGTIQTQRDFMFDGQEFTAGARLDTDMEVDTYIIDALYKVYGSDRAEILVGGGLHLIDFSVDLEASAFIGEASGSRSNGSSDILAPLPNLRAQGFYALTPRWALMATVGWLGANYEDYDGSFTYVHARTIYRVTERFGVGLGYQFLDVDLTEDRPHGEAGFDIQFQGPAAYLAYSF